LQSEAPPPYEVAIVSEAEHSLSYEAPEYHPLPQQVSQQVSFSELQVSPLEFKELARQAAYDTDEEIELQKEIIQAAAEQPHNRTKKQKQIVEKYDKTLHLIQQNAAYCEEILKDERYDQRVRYLIIEFEKINEYKIASITTGEAPMIDKWGQLKDIAEQRKRWIRKNLQSRSDTTKSQVRLDLIQDEQRPDSRSTRQVSFRDLHLEHGVGMTLDKGEESILAERRSARTDEDSLGMMRGGKRKHPNQIEGDHTHSLYPQEQPDRGYYRSRDDDRGGRGRVLRTTLTAPEMAESIGSRGTRQETQTKKGSRSRDQGMS